MSYGVATLEHLDQTAPIRDADLGDPNSGKVADMAGPRSVVDSPGERNHLVPLLREGLRQVASDESGAARYGYPRHRGDPTLSCCRSIRWPGGFGEALECRSGVRARHLAGMLLMSKAESKCT